jgi:DNA transformation protein
MNQQNEFVGFVMDSLAMLGPVQAKRMFGGYGIFQQGRMFAIIIGDCLYLKADQESRADFEERNLQPFRYLARGKTVSLSYFECPAEAFDESDVMRCWTGKALAAALRAATKKPAKKS